MNAVNLTRHKSYLIFSILGIFAVCIVFFFIFNQFNSQDGQVSTPLSQADIKDINTSIRNELSDVFKPEELVITQYKGDHKWALALVTTTNPEVEEGGFAIMKNTDSGWEVAYGPATDYYAEDLREMGVPQSLIGQINDVFIPPGH